MNFIKIMKQVHPIQVESDARIYEDVHFTSDSNVDDSDIDSHEALLVDEEHNGDSSNVILGFTILKEYESINTRWR